jgi:hypothetical protein
MPSLGEIRMSQQDPEVAEAENEENDGVAEENEQLNEEASSVEFAAEDGPEELTQGQLDDFNQAVLWGTDWTVETIIAQMRRGNIEINPQFQRRDAWSRHAKSSFIESLLIGLPIPQVVLAERRDQRGSFLILDGKQRLLSIMQFAGLAENSPSNSFGLSGLEVRTDLRRKKFRHFETRPELRADLNAFLSHTIRAVVIRNWPSMAFLHVVFHRLNSGSLKLSAQELRQALVPGPFTVFADDLALESAPIHRLLHRTTADPRMRDTELLVRYLSLKHFLPSYAGRMKEFLDESCGRFNAGWADLSQEAAADSATFISVIEAMETVFPDGVARKAGSKLFNRSIFDTLAYFATEAAVREAMLAAPDAVRDAYLGVVGNADFQNAVDSDTAGIPHTSLRFEMMGQALAAALEMNIQVPGVAPNEAGQLRFVI